MFTRYPKGLCLSELTALAKASGLYERTHPYFTSARACAMVIFSGVWAISNGMNSCQCCGRVSRPAASSLVKWCRGQRREQAKNGQPWGPNPNRLEGSLPDSGGVIVHAENEGSDRINV